MLQPDDRPQAEDDHQVTHRHRGLRKALLHQLSLRKVGSTFTAEEACLILPDYIAQSVHAALSQLSKDGLLARVAKGIYVIGGASAQAMPVDGDRGPLSTAILDLAARVEALERSPLSQFSTAELAAELNRRLANNGS